MSCLCTSTFFNVVLLHLFYAFKAAQSRHWFVVYFSAKLLFSYKFPDDILYVFIQASRFIYYSSYVHLEVNVAPAIFLISERMRYYGDEEDT